jgi:transcriptional regulator with GAF, ATPase, and Fis domain
VVVAWTGTAWYQKLAHAFAAGIPTRRRRAPALADGLPTMPFCLDITDRAGSRDLEVETESFWLGGPRSGCEVEVDLPGVFGRVLEVARDDRGRLRVRAEAGLPFPIRCATGSVGARFESFLDGDVLNVGPALVKVRYRAEPLQGSVEALDPAALAQAPGSPVGSWYRTFMDMADHLEGLKSPEQMVPAAMAAILRATGADRVHVELDDDSAQAFFLSRPDDRRPFRPSRTLLDQVRASNRVVHVPVAASDPVARTFHSVRSEGISAAVALPVQALGKNLGVIYADCTRDGAVLSAEDLQRVAFCARILATALGNRVLVRSLLDRPAAASSHWALATRSPAFAEVVERVKLYAPADYTVLLRGETGTGKEVIARTLHELSRRSKGPFVPVNCAAIPEQLMESVLFGHEKGAFTGALQPRRGHFEEAHGGTIFLDEIGDMALDLQAKILRVLQDRVVVPIGSRRQVRVDVRIVAATHQDLERMGREGRFREDLYYRLRELEIVLPALRERREDLPLLVARFCQEAAEELGLAEVPSLSPGAEARLGSEPWRGNIRELRHVVKGAVLRANGGQVQEVHLELDRRRDVGAAPMPASAPVAVAPADAPPAASAPQTWKDRLEAQEKEALQRTFAEANGNLTRAAELFGVPRTTYREKLVRHGLLEG